MQDAWVAFARNPKAGLRSQQWSKYQKLGNVDVREFGAGSPAKDVSIAEMEALCDGAAPSGVNAVGHMGEMVI